jgi:hypothetical protein
MNKVPRVQASSNLAILRCMSVFVRKAWLEISGVEVAKPRCIQRLTKFAAGAARRQGQSPRRGSFRRSSGCFLGPPEPLAVRSQLDAVLFFLLGSVGGSLAFAFSEMHQSCHLGLARRNCLLNPQLQTEYNASPSDCIIAPLVRCLVPLDLLVLPHPFISPSVCAMARDLADRVARIRYLQ